MTNISAFIVLHRKSARSRQILDLQRLQQELHGSTKRNVYSAQENRTVSTNYLAVMLLLLLLVLIGTTSAADPSAENTNQLLYSEPSDQQLPNLFDNDDALWSSRQPRSPISPPTVASQQPHRRGISAKMTDSSLQVGRQSEGPSHPSQMRKAPPRKQSSELFENDENMSRPHTMFHSQKEPLYIQPGDYYMAQSEDEQQAHYSAVSQQQYPAAHRLRNQNHYVEYDEPMNPAYYYDNQDLIREVEIPRPTVDERRSRQRRVENSLRRETDVIGHGRFGGTSGNRNTNVELLERYDTFGIPISEQLWAGLRRSGSPIHPSARAIPNRNREPSQVEDNSIWSNGASRPYGNFRPQYTRNGNRRPFDAEEHIKINEHFNERKRGNVLFHPGARMTSHVSSSRSGGGIETIITHSSDDRSSAHPRLFIRPRVYQPASPSLEQTVSLTDVMNRMNLTYEELNVNLDEKGLSFTYLLRLLSRGTPLEEVVTILEFSNPHDTTTTTTTIEPITQTVDHLVWEQWLNREIEKENMEIINNHPVEIDRKLPNNPYYSDPIYAEGVYPINENLEYDPETDQLTRSSNDNMLQANLSNNDYYIEEPENRKTSGQARIHSFTVHELPYDEVEDPQTNQYVQPEEFDYPSRSPHPHFNQWDQTYESDDMRMNNIGDRDLQPQFSSNILLNATPEDNGEPRTLVRGLISEPTNKSRPLTYTVIAACAVMGSLAIFTLFVLIAYTVVKCTKKPTLNNYQVSDKKPVEIAT